MAKKATKTAAKKTRSAKKPARAKSKPTGGKTARKTSTAKKRSTKKTAAKTVAKKAGSAKKAAPEKKSTKKKVSKKTAAKSKATKSPASTKPATKTSAKAKKQSKSKAAAKPKASKPARPPRRNRPKSGLQAAFEAALAVSDEPKRAASKLKASELDEFRHLLLIKRAQLLGDFEQLQEEAHNDRRGDSAGDLSAMPIHMADIGSDNWDQEFNLVLLQNERNLLREIDDALERIKEGTYGICVATGRPISKARLRAKPWAKYCIEYARKKEIGHG